MCDLFCLCGLFRWGKYFGLRLHRAIWVPYILLGSLKSRHDVAQYLDLCESMAN